MSNSELTIEENWESGVVTAEDDQVCNFAIRRIRSSEPANDEQPVRHVLRVRLETGERRTWLVQGDLFDIQNWREVIDEGATIADEALFIDYLQNCINKGRQERRQYLPSLHFWGVYKDYDDRMHVSEPPAGGSLSRNTVYVQQRLPDGPNGDKAVFQQMSRFTDDASVQAILCYALGSVLRAGTVAYPILKVPADSQAADALAHAIEAAFGFPYVDASTDLRTEEATMSVLADTNLPVLVGGIDDLEPPRQAALLQEIGDCYVGFCPGCAPEGQPMLQAPVIAFGEEMGRGSVGKWPDTLCFPLETEALDLGAVREFRDSAQQFPTREWLRFACTYMHGVSVSAKIWDSALRLWSQVDVEKILLDFGTRHILNNHGVLVFVADALRAYGLAVDIEDYMLKHLEESILLWLDKGRDASVPALKSALDRLTSESRFERSYETTREGIYLTAYFAGQSQDERERTPPVCLQTDTTWFLILQGIGEKREHEFGGASRPTFFVSFEKLEELGIDFEP